MYWAALGSWDIRTSETSRPRLTSDVSTTTRQLAKRTATTDDPDGRELLPGSGVDPDLPRPPDELLKSTDFTLTTEEERYLSDVIAGSTKGSMLSWLIHHPPGNLPDYVWEVDNLNNAPAQLAELTDHARRFHTAIHGAALVYNLLLARKAGRDDLTADYEAGLDSGAPNCRSRPRCEGWSRTDWWATIHRRNPRLRPITRSFVDRWIDLTSTDDRSGHTAERPPI